MSFGRLEDFFTRCQYVLRPACDFTYFGRDTSYRFEQLAGDKTNMVGGLRLGMEILKHGTSSYIRVSPIFFAA